jgi:hypothetical protein
MLWHHRARRLLRISAAVAPALAAIAVVVVVVLSPWGGTGPSLIENALAALGERGPVVHSILAVRDPDAAIVALATGDARPAVTEVEFFVDEERNIVRTIVRRNAVVVADLVSRPGAAPRAYRELEGFATGYRSELEAGSAISAGTGTVEKRPVSWLRLPNLRGLQTRVALDPDSGRALVIEVRPAAGSGAAMSARVLRMETIARDPADFEPASLEGPQPGGGRIIASEKLTLREAAAALARPAVWAGRAVGKLRLRAVELDTLSRTYPTARAKGPTRGRGLTLLYGAVRGDEPDRTGRFLRIRQATYPEPAFGFLPDAVAVAPPPSEGFMRLERLSTAGGEAIWTGTLRHSGLYVVLDASDREPLIEAARSLSPISGILPS